MFRLLRRKRGQSTLEYAILIVVVIVALIAIQGYLNRAIQGQMEERSNQIGEQYDANSAAHKYTTTTDATVKETANPWDSQTDYLNHSQTRTGWQNLSGYGALWNR